MADLSVTYTLEEAFKKVRETRSAVISFLNQRKTQMQAATVNADIPLSVVWQLDKALVIFDALAAVPGIGAYAQAQVNDPTFDVSVWWTNLRAAIVACSDGIWTSFPKDASGYAAYLGRDANRNVTMRTFTSAQLASAVTLIDAVIAAI